jgi:hypothetical protein
VDKMINSPNHYQAENLENLLHCSVADKRMCRAEP